MKFLSTKGGEKYTFSEAAKKGLASDGGLFIPESFPIFNLSDFENTKSLAETASLLLRPFLEGDSLENELQDICKNAFNFPAPLIHLDDEISLLELFHGPTAAFKDFGARFLAECFSRLKLSKKITILVATSGDTGGAIASAFNEKPGIEVGVLFPKGGVSSFQKHQLCCWGENIKSLEVKGTFDDCQALVKEAFQNKQWTQNKELTSANSINIGRLLPQMVYYAHISLLYQKDKKKRPHFIIPTGNLGNAVAAFWVKKMGFPIDKITLASNANKVIPDFFKTQKWSPKTSIATIANAMDVGNPSNMERLLHLYPKTSDLFKDAEAFSVNDDQIRETIISFYKKNKIICCPHTATAACLQKHLKIQNAIIVATAHPAKFSDVITPLLKIEVPIPASLDNILKKNTHFEEIDKNLQSLTEKMFSGDKK